MQISLNSDIIHLHFRDWLIKAEYEYLLALFVELRRRTTSPYVSEVEKDHPLFKRKRVSGTLTAKED